MPTANNPFTKWLWDGNVDNSSGGGGVSDHTELTGVTSDQHHASSHAHGSHTGIGAADHHGAFVQADHDALANPHHSNANDHPQAHTVVSHSDTTATGPELDTLTGGGETALHSHAGGGGGPNVKSGVMSIADGGTQAVVFGTAFVGTPRVVLTLEGATAATDIAELTEAPTTAGFTARVQKGHTGGGHTWNVHWMATDAGDP